MPNKIHILFVFLIVFILTALSKETQKIKTQNIKNYNPSNFIFAGNKIQQKPTIRNL